MERLVWLVWRAFWVGVGACAVLVVQATTTPASARRTPALEDPSAVPVAPAPRAPLARPGV